MEVGRILHPIPERAWIQRELWQCTHTPFPKDGEKKRNPDRAKSGGGEENSQDITLRTRTEFFPGMLSQVGFFTTNVHRGIDHRQGAAVAGTALLTLHHTCALQQCTGDRCQFLPHQSHLLSPTRGLVKLNSKQALLSCISRT